MFIFAPRVVYIGLLIKTQMEKLIKFSKSNGWAYSLFTGNIPTLFLLCLIYFPNNLSAQITQANPNAIYSSADALLFKNSDKKQDTPSQKSITQDNIIHIIGDAIVYNLENIIIKQEPYKGKEKKEIQQKALFTRKQPQKKETIKQFISPIKNVIEFPDTPCTSYFTTVERIVSAVQNNPSHKVIYTTILQSIEKKISSAIFISYHLIYFRVIADTDSAYIRPPPSDYI